jgi:uncharacterized protein (DUF1778 family)
MDAAAEPRRTKIPMRAVGYRLPQKDVDLLHIAARHEGVAQTTFLRQAIRERAVRILAGEAAPW